KVRILAAFQVGDERTGERIYLSGQRDTLFDVTAISADHVHSSDLGVVAIHRHEGRILLNALRPGSARVMVRSHTPNIDYGSAPVVVTEDPVSVRSVTAELVVDIEVGVMHAVEKPNEFLISSRILNTLTHRYQHALLACRIHYSDEQSTELSDIGVEEYMLNVWSGDERSLAVIQRNSHALVELIALDDTHDAVINAELRGPPHCADPDAPPIASQETLVHIRFDDAVRTSRTVNLKEANSTITTDVETRGWRLETLLGALIVLGIIIGALHMVGYRARRPLSEGYEKLVLPIITRLSSSGSCGKDENSHEWVWLSKAQIDSGSINSRYSQKSTIGVAENSTSSVDTHRSISYRGSEISVFISPQPVISVNNDTLGRHTTSWRGKPKVRMARNAMLDSSSEHNLSRYTNGSVMLARSEGEMRDSWREMDRRYPCRREESWRNSTRSSKWSDSGPMPEYLSGLRESVA
uniref:Transmembrane protein family 132 middle domain-containing protein n=1 Tax=Parascaris univalens TaxID=6257 RepID=A0A915CCX6_PARUN